MAQPFDNRRLELTGAPVPVAEQVGTSGGRWAAFSASANGALAYWRAGSLNIRNVQLNWGGMRKGTSLGVVGETGFLSFAFSVAKFRTLAAAGLRNHRMPWTVWLLDFSRGGAGTRFIFGGTSEGSLVRLPDGNRIVFGSRRDGARRFVREAGQRLEG